MRTVSAWRNTRTTLPRRRNSADRTHNGFESSKLHISLAGNVRADSPVAPTVSSSIFVSSLQGENNPQTIHEWTLPKILPDNLRFHFYTFAFQFLAIH